MTVEHHAIYVDTSNRPCAEAALRAIDNLAAEGWEVIAILPVQRASNREVWLRRDTRGLSRLQPMETGWDRSTWNNDQKPEQPAPPGFGPAGQAAENRPLGAAAGPKPRRDPRESLAREGVVNHQTGTLTDAIGGLGHRMADALNTGSSPAAKAWDAYFASGRINASTGPATIFLAGWHAALAAVREHREPSNDALLAGLAAADQAKERHPYPGFSPTRAVAACWQAMLDHMLRSLDGEQR